MSLLSSTFTFNLNYAYNHSSFECYHQLLNLGKLSPGKPGLGSTINSSVLSSSVSIMFINKYIATQMPSLFLEPEFLVCQPGWLSCLFRLFVFAVLLELRAEMVAQQSLALGSILLLLASGTHAFPGYSSPSPRAPSSFASTRSSSIPVIPGQPSDSPPSKLATKSEDTVPATDPAAATTPSPSPTPGLSSSSGGIYITPDLSSDAAPDSSSTEQEAIPVTDPTTASATSTPAVTSEPASSSSENAVAPGPFSNSGSDPDSDSNPDSDDSDPDSDSGSGSDPDPNSDSDPNSDAGSDPNSGGGDSGPDSDSGSDQGAASFSPISATIPAPTTPTGDGEMVAATNPANPDETVSIVKQQVPEDQKDNFPLISFGDALPLSLTVGEDDTPVIVDFSGQMAVPLGSAPDWLTPDVFPAPGSIGNTDSGSDSGSDACKANPSSDSTTSSPSPTSSDATSTTSETSQTSSSSSASDTPSSTLNCQQNIATDGPSASQVAKALQDDDAFSGFCDDQSSESSLYQSIKHGMLEISVTRGSPDDTLEFCKQGMQEIMDTCITGSSDYGGVYTQGTETYNITNTIFPYNPLEVDVDDGAPPTPVVVPSSDSSEPSEPPTPSETDGNNDGSSICKTLGDTCKVAYQAFNDDFIYKDYTYYSTIEGDTSWANFVHAGNGCKAEFKCDDYGDGMSGKQIKKA